MMKKRLTILMLMSLILITSLNAFAYTDKEVIDIKVIGNQFIPAKRVRAMLFTKEGNTFSIKRLKKDLEAIRNMGYFDNVQANVSNYKNGKQIVYQLEENSVLSDVTIKNNKNVSKEKIKNLLNVNSLEIINMNKVEEGIKRIKDYYANKGFILVEIDKKVQDGVLYLTIKEGMINKILVEGNEDIATSTVRTEIFLEPNTAYNKFIAKRSKKNLMNTGYFNNVDYKIVKLTGEDYQNQNHYNVIYKINEGATFPFGIGLRYNDLEGFRYLIGYKKVNSWGQGQKIHFLRNKGSDQEIYDFGYYRPASENMTFAIDTTFKYKDLTTLDDVDYKISQGRLGFGYDFGPLTNTNFGFNYGKYEDVATKEKAKTLGLDIQGERSNLNEDLKEGNRQFLKAEFIKNQPDNDSIKETDYIKAVLETETYIPLPFTETNNFFFELKAEAIKNDEPIPHYLRTYLTELNGVSEELIKSNNDYMGNNKVYANLEYQFTPFEQLPKHKMKSLTLYTYVNAGQTSKDGIETDNLHQTMGIGFNIDTPLGLIDLKYNDSLDKVEEDLMNDITFTLTKKY